LEFHLLGKVPRGDVVRKEPKRCQDPGESRTGSDAPTSKPRFPTLGGYQQVYYQRAGNRGKGERVNLQRGPRPETPDYVFTIVFVLKRGWVGLGGLLTKKIRPGPSGTGGRTLSTAAQRENGVLPVKWPSNVLPFLAKKP